MGLIILEMIKPKHQDLTFYILNQIKKCSLCSKKFLDKGCNSQYDLFLSFTNEKPSLPLSCGIVWLSLLDWITLLKANLCHWPFQWGWRCHGMSSQGTTFRSSPWDLSLTHQLWATIVRTMNVEIHFKINFVLRAAKTVNR